MRRLLRRTVPLLPGLLLLTLIISASRQPSPGLPAEGPYLLATATTGGTFYPVGVALATLTKQVLEPQSGMSLAAISSAGSEENLKLLREREAGFAILQAVYGAWAWYGHGRLAQRPPFTDLRSVTALWPNVEHFVVRRTLAPTGTIEDLARFDGRRFSIGARYSGAEGSARHLLGSLGLVPEEIFTVVYQGYGGSADALQDGLIDGMNTPAGVPVGAVTRALATDPELVILQFSAEHAGRANAAYGELWRRYTIPANTYPNQPEPMTTLAQANFLAVHAAVPDAHVYEIVRLIYEHLDFLHAFHPATRQMALESALQGLPVPLHPGALRYFCEQGLPIPARLAAGGSTPPARDQAGLHPCTAVGH